MFEGQRDQGHAFDEMDSSEVKIELPRLNQQSHHFLYSGGEFVRLYPANPSSTRNHTAKTKRWPRACYKFALDIEGLKSGPYSRLKSPRMYTRSWHGLPEDHTYAKTRGSRGTKYVVKRGKRTLGMCSGTVGVVAQRLPGRILELREMKASSASHGRISACLQRLHPCALFGRERAQHVFQ